MNRYTIKSHPDSRYTSLELCSEGEVVMFSDLSDEVIEMIMIEESLATKQEAEQSV